MSDSHKWVDENKPGEVAAAADDLRGAAIADVRYDSTYDEYHVDLKDGRELVFYGIWFNTSTAGSGLHYGEKEPDPKVAETA